MKYHNMLTKALTVNSHIVQCMRAEFNACAQNSELYVNLQCMRAEFNACAQNSESYVNLQCSSYSCRLVQLYACTSSYQYELVQL